ncbi:hypothetical protein KP509_20G061500 [Ceratopteris richardii]|uniref:Uncharacterized protein n=1 Tax=Ceratopteris richardii TaxID=49495 RepID=A0A8T2SJ96_CERRI|nr:hypothetical protein KP509_20G061500 [Ceratopteris richardii]
MRVFVVRILQTANHMSLALVQAYSSDEEVQEKFSGSDSEEEEKGTPCGAIVEAKPQAGDFTNEGTPVVKKESSEKPPEATAKLLGVCPEEGLICPICKVRRIDSGDPNKRRGSRIKDKERSKRMKGQSSHATWKSETEMQLRQHFERSGAKRTDRAINEISD